MMKPGQQEMRRKSGMKQPNRTAQRRDPRQGMRPSMRQGMRPSEPQLRTEDRFERTEDPLREDRLEGRNPIFEALRAGREIEKLWYLRNDRGQPADPVLRRLVKQVGETQAVLLPVDRATLDRLSFTHNHQGAIAQVALLPTVEVEDLIASAQSKGEDPFLLIADEIQDAYNLGSLFRIAEAAGVHGIILPRRRQVGLDAVTAKASAGAINHVPCARVTNLVQTLQRLKQKGIWVGGATMEGESLEDHPALSGPLALVIGNEGKGLSPLVRKTCDFLVSIPMKGQLNSLNAAVAAGIVVFEAVRLRRKAQSLPSGMPRA